MDRNTRVLEAGAPSAFPTDPEEVARLEARNALRQFDAAMDMVDAAVSSSVRFVLRPSQLLNLNSLATEEVEADCGVYRRCGIEIEGSKHSPPKWQDVPVLVEELCDYINQNWEKTPIHLAAYLMWRVNWVHPFANGNGRTSRMIAYVVLCVRLGFRLPGTVTVPEQISKAKLPYYGALEAADTACAQGEVNVEAMEELLAKLLATQLLAVHDDATGH